MLNNDNGDHNYLVLLKVQGLRAEFLNRCMHTAKYKVPEQAGSKECRTSQQQ